MLETKGNRTISKSKSNSFFTAKLKWKQTTPDPSGRHDYGIKLISRIKPATKLIPRHQQFKQLLKDKGLKKFRESRSNQRGPYRKPIFFATFDKTYVGLTNNISRGGVFIEIRNQFLIGQKIKLAIPRTQIFNGVFLEGEIVHLAQNGIGIKFIKKIISYNYDKIVITDVKDPRAHPRRILNKNLKVKINGHICEAFVTNFSCGGAYIKVKKNFIYKQNIQLLIPSNRISKDIKLKGGIVWCSKTGFGVRFS